MEIPSYPNVEEFYNFTEVLRKEFLYSNKGKGEKNAVSEGWIECLTLVLVYRSILILC